MKAKLLREVRKRYKIYRYPNGINCGFIQTSEITLVLKDGSEIITYSEKLKKWGSSPMFYVNGVISPEKEAIINMKEEMLRIILRDYQNKGVRRIKHQQVRNTIYYNENITNK